MYNLSPNEHSMAYRILLGLVIQGLEFVFKIGLRMGTTI